MAPLIADYQTDHQSTPIFSKIDTWLIFLFATTSLIVFVVSCACCAGAKRKTAKPRHQSKAAEDASFTSVEMSVPSGQDNTSKCPVELQRADSLMGVEEAQNRYPKNYEADIRGERDKNPNAASNSQRESIEVNPGNIDHAEAQTGRGDSSFLLKSCSFIADKLAPVNRKSVGRVVPAILASTETSAQEKPKKPGVKHKYLVMMRSRSKTVSPVQPVSKSVTLFQAPAVKATTATANVKAPATTATPPTKAKDKARLPAIKIEKPPQTATQGTAMVGSQESGGTTTTTSSSSAPRSKSCAVKSLDMVSLDPGADATKEKSIQAPILV